MSNGIQSINNSVKNTTLASKTPNKLELKQQTGMGFEALFANAMGNTAPQARLSSMQEQLREALSSQQDKKTHTDNPNTENAQAMVWAQRSWANQQQNNPTETTSTLGEAFKTKATNTQANASSKPLDNTNAAQAQKQAEPANTDQQERPVSENKANTGQANTSTIAAGNALQEANQIASGNTATPAEQPDPLNGLNSLSNTDLQSPTPEQTLQTIQTDTAAKNANSLQASTAQPQAENTHRKKAADISIRVETDADNTDTSMQSISSMASNAVNNAQGQTANASNAAASVAAAQTMQAKFSNAEFGERQLATGDKILATATGPATANTPTNTPLVAGTNGLGTGRTGSAEQALIKTPVNQPGFAKELNQTVNWAIGKNMSTVDIRVNPESFGPMNMRIVQKGQQIQLIIRTQDEASGNLLNQALSGLKEAMAQTGLQLNQVQIQTSSPQNQATNGQTQAQTQFEQQGRQHQQSQNPGSSRQPNSNQGAQASSDTTAQAVKNKSSGTGLDLFA